MAFFAVVMAGCAARGPLPISPTAELCGKPSRVVVAEFEGSEDLRFAATDALVEGLAALGFEVMAPRHPPPEKRRKPEPLDWIFGGEVHAEDPGGIQLEVDLRSLRDRRRVWAIVDTKADGESDAGDSIVRRTVAAALEKFELDVLTCRRDGL